MDGAVLVDRELWSAGTAARRLSCNYLNRSAVS
jgi:hypothetical protein